MDIVILTRRGIAYQRVRRGEQQVIFLPSDEAVKVYKDITDTSTIAERYGAQRSPPLWRQAEGQLVVYGLLPEALAQRRQALKVWLAQDFAPAEATAVMYVFDKKWVVFSRRDINDEGVVDWRTTLLKAEEDISVSDLIGETANDVMLDDVDARVCVAVYEDLELYESLQEKLKPLDIKPVPFSSLKVSPRAKPLYRQRDYGALMILSILLLTLLFAASAAYWFVTWLELQKVDGHIRDVRRQISNIEVNQNLGQLNDPHQVLRTMQKAFEAQPSAIVDAAARIGREFGELDSVKFSVGKDNTGNTRDNINPLEPGQHEVTANIGKPTNTLLVDQERLATLLMADAPWARQIENLPVGGSGLTLRIVLQTEKTEGRR
ncbi:MAG: hypothetical protein H6922_05665 [Pseudomonadaceae bacterium]|nr:hypothetical protein [Pseudomonadaceae bacterium]